MIIALNCLGLSVFFLVSDQILLLNAAVSCRGKQKPVTFSGSSLRSSVSLYSKCNEMKERLNKYYLNSLLQFTFLSIYGIAYFIYIYLYISVSYFYTFLRYHRAQDMYSWKSSSSTIRQHISHDNLHRSAPECNVKTHYALLNAVMIARHARTQH